jgi:hypothetical protein
VEYVIYGLFIGIPVLFIVAAIVATIRTKGQFDVEEELE